MKKSLLYLGWGALVSVTSLIAFAIVGAFRFLRGFDYTKETWNDEKWKNGKKLKTQKIHKVWRPKKK